MNRWLLCAVALFSATGTIWANAGPPPRLAQLFRGPVQLKLVIEVDENLKEPRLEIPQNLIGREPRPGRQEPGADAGRVPTAVAGVALAAAFVTGGFWLTRRSRNVAAVSLAFLILGGALMADVRFPSRPEKKTTPVALPANLSIASDKLVVEVTDKGEVVRLIVPKGMVGEAKIAPKPDVKRDE